MLEYDNPKVDAIHLEEQALFELPGLIKFFMVIFSFVVGASLLVFPWQIVLAIFFGLALLVAIFRNPYWALIVFLMGAVFHPTHHFQELQKFHLAKNLAFLVVFAWAVHIMVYRDFKIIKSIQTIFLSGFLLFAFFACFIYFDFSFNYFMEFGTKAFILYFAITGLINGRKRLINFISILIGCSLVNAIAGIYQYITGTGMLYAEEGIVRSFGFELDPNYLAMNLTMSIPIAVEMFFAFGRKRIKSIFLGTIIVLIIANILTFSRAGLLQLCTVIWLSLGVRLIKKYKVVGVFILVFLFLFSLPFIPAKYYARMGTILNFQESAIALRFAGWQNGIEMIKDHPVRGVGFGIFRYEFLMRSFLSDSPLKMLFDAQNTFIQTAAEIGLIGFVFFLLIIWFVIKSTSKAEINFNNKNDIMLAQISRGVRVGFIAYLIGGMFYSYLHLIILWIIVPISVVLVEFSKNQEILR
ncbi:MAG: O-antigen ligase family protein [Candidatus Omnitrophica bacterium]|nr:O-antigen ligase family protein [Candidatus Omnitrophota bacterium]